MKNLTNYKDQTVGFEVEMSRFRIEKKDLENKKPLMKVYIKDNSSSKLFFKIVSEGANGSDNPYFEIVSKPYSTEEEIKSFFDAVFAICNAVKQQENGNTVSKLFDSIKSGLESMRTKLCNKRLVCRPLYDDVKDCKLIKGIANTYTNSIHINVLLPFAKIRGLADCGFYNDNNNPQLFQLPYVCKLVEEKFSEFVDTSEESNTSNQTKKKQVSEELKSLLMLFFYQHAVYVKEHLKYETVERDINMLYESEKTDESENNNETEEPGEPKKNSKTEEPNSNNGTGNSNKDNNNKLKFDILFKVSKADIIDKVLKNEGGNDYKVLLDYNKIKENLKSIKNLIDVSSPLNVENCCKVLLNNVRRKFGNNTSVTDDKKKYTYDEPRISGLIRPKEIAGAKGYFVVAEIRTDRLFSTYLNSDLKKAINNFDPNKNKEYQDGIENFIKKLGNIITKINNSKS